MSDREDNKDTQKMTEKFPIGTEVSGEGYFTGRTWRGLVIGYDSGGVRIQAGDSTPTILNVRLVTKLERILK